MSLQPTENDCAATDAMDTKGYAAASSPATASSSGSGSDENESTIRARTAAAPLKNVSRERMKAERAFLGSKVVELERELSALLAKKAVARCATPSPAWRGLAKRQHARRLKAEDENARLKSRLLYQLQVAKSLETILRNRASTFLEDVSDGGAERVRYPLHDLAALHEQCMDEIDQAYPLVDSIFRDDVWAEDASHGQSTRRSTVLTQQDNGHERLFVDLRNTCYAPFPLERVCQATWKAITTEYGRQNRLIEQSALTEEEYMSKFWLPHTPIIPHTHDRYSATITMRKFQEDTRMVLVWRSLNLKETPLGSCLYGDETGWVVVERARDPVTQEPSEHASTVRVCTRYVPIWDGKPDRRPVTLALVDSAEGELIQSLVSKDASTAAGEFTNHVLMGTEADIASITEAIENILLDEAIGSSDDDLGSMVEELEMLAAGIDGQGVAAASLALDFGL